MRLAIADPPYLGRAHRHYGDDPRRAPFGSGPARRAAGRADRPRTTTPHPQAAVWDDPATHVALVEHLAATYDGWVVALHASSLPTYLAAAPSDARVGVWVNARPVPGGGRVIGGWEPVLYVTPQARRARQGPGSQVRDVLICPPPDVGHVGAKPGRWTRWVLDLLGHDQDTDTVDDLYPGSLSVGREVDQLVIGFL